MAAIRPSCSPGACLITGPLLEPLAEKTPPAPDHQPKHQSPCRHQPPGLPGSQVRLGPQPGQGPASCRGPQGGGGGSVASQARVSSQEEQPPAGPGTQLCASWLGSRPREPGLWKHLWAVAPSGLDVDMPSLLRAPKFRGKWGNLDCDGPAPPPGARQAKASLLPRSCVSHLEQGKPLRGPQGLPWCGRKWGAVLPTAEFIPFSSVCRSRRCCSRREGLGRGRAGFQHPAPSSGKGSFQIRKTEAWLLSHISQWFTSHSFPYH